MLGAVCSSSGPLPVGRARGLCAGAVGGGAGPGPHTEASERASSGRGQDKPTEEPPQHPSPAPQQSETTAGSEAEGNKHVHYVSIAVVKDQIIP